MISKPLARALGKVVQNDNYISTAAYYRCHQYHHPVSVHSWVLCPFLPSHCTFKWLSVHLFTILLNKQMSAEQLEIAPAFIG